ncbi:MAG: thiamine diphosphokinase [Clostridiales bacterium]|jgi:thiamine pyrophosphokinase|nr:thiamine diphosphokinase [Clostridiales bacterium]
MKKNAAAVILNGLYAPEKIAAAYIAAADGGYNLLRERGIVPDIIIGDNDSLRNPSDVPPGVKRLNFPSDKDMTDGELALRHVAGAGFKNIRIYGALGGRADHAESNLALLCLAERLGARAAIEDGNTEIHYLGGRFKTFSAHIPRNISVSVVPFYSFAHIISTKGLKYPVRDTRLFKYSSLGMSNRSVDENVEVNISKGCALIFINF